MEPTTRELVRMRLETIAAENSGLLTPEAVLRDAKKPTSPLHNLFEWDVKKAARQHWLDTARALIRGVRVTVQTETSIISTVAYVRDPDLPSGEQGYRSVVSLRSEREKARDAIVQEFGRASSVLRRAREIAEALDLTGEVEGIIAHLDEVKGMAADRVLAGVER